MHPLPLEFLLATVNADELPPSRAEVAFLGRSNVGKSSLLNALAKQKQLARVSNTPGRTQVLACFSLVGTKGTLVDCPGYGFAKVPKEVRDSWQPMLEHYLTTREQLKKILLLIDGEIGPTASDQEFLAWLRSENLPVAVIATKVDRLKQGKRAARQRELAAGCKLSLDEVLWVSSTDNTGIDQLRALVREWLTPPR
jgi:GTP-binding protein